MNFIALLLKICLSWGPPPGSPPPPPNLPLGEDHMLHPSTGVSGSSGGPSPAPPPTALLAWPLWAW